MIRLLLYEQSDLGLRSLLRHIRKIYKISLCHMDRWMTRDFKCFFFQQYFTYIMTMGR